MPYNTIYPVFRYYILNDNGYNSVYLVSLMSEFNVQVCIVTSSVVETACDVSCWCVIKTKRRRFRTEFRHTDIRQFVLYCWGVRLVCVCVLQWHPLQSQLMKMFLEVRVSDVYHHTKEWSFTVWKEMSFVTDLTIFS